MRVVTSGYTRVAFSLFATNSCTTVNAADPSATSTIAFSRGLISIPRIVSGRSAYWMEHQQLIDTFTTSLFATTDATAATNFSRKEGKPRVTVEHHISMQVPEHVLCYSLLRRYVIAAGEHLLSARLLCCVLSVTVMVAAVLIAVLHLDRPINAMLLETPWPGLALAAVLACEVCLAVSSAADVNSILQPFGVVYQVAHANWISDRRAGDGEREVVLAGGESAEPATAVGEGIRHGTTLNEDERPIPSSKASTRGIQPSIGHGRASGATAVPTLGEIQLH